MARPAARENRSTVTLDRIFLHLYTSCQKAYHEIDAELMSQPTSQHVRPLSEAMLALRKLTGFSREPDIDRAVSRAEVRGLRRQFRNQYGAIGLFYLLRAADSLLNEFRSILQRRAAVRLSMYRWLDVIVPKPYAHLVKGNSRQERGRGCESRRIADRLENFCVVRKHEMPVHYLPIGDDGLPGHATSQAPLVHALGAGVRIPRILCANFPHSTSTFAPERLPADRGWQQNGYRSTFLFRKHDSLEEAKLELEQLLNTAHDQKVHVLVLPELTIPDELLERIRRHMQHHSHPMLVVAGSWHRETPGRIDRVNACPVLGIGGEELGRFCKTYRFEMTDTEIAELRPILGDELCSHPGPACERIRLGSHGLVIDAGSIRFGIAICIDVLRVSGLIDTYIQLGVNCLLVPALSFRADRFTAHAKNFAEMSNGIVAFSNPPSLVAAPDSPRGRELGSRITLGFGRATAWIAGQTAGSSERPLEPYERVHAVLEPQDLDSAGAAWPS